MRKNRPKNQSNSIRLSHNCIGTLRDKLARNMKLEASHKRKFISRDCLDQIWSDKNLREYVLGLGIGNWIFIELNLIKTLSILAWIHWDDWTRLSQIFTKHTDANNIPDRLDKDLPYPDNALLARTDFLADSCFADQFYEAQFIFLPVVLIENRDLEFPRDRRLPFVSESDSMGTGSYGTVTKVVVAKGHFMNAQGNTISWEKPLARKRLEFEPDFRKEVQNLRTLKRNQLTHQRIMKHCGSLIHGNDCNIFFEWADFNAQDLLFERCDESTCPNVTPINLLREASNLAGALWFLHHQLDDIFCCHMDLKPDNILVVRDDDSPVGQWMITDFGISVFFKEPSRNKTNNEFLSVRELEENIRHQTTRTVPKRRPGPFQPPEVESISDAGKVGRKGDVWSFGCVLTMVLAFALGGRRLVEEFDCIRGSEDDDTDYFYHFRSVPVGAHKAQIPEVKPEILAWLQSLSHRFSENSSWISKCVDLINQTLTIEQSGRPEAEDVKRILREIFYEMDGISSPNVPVESLSIPPPPKGRASSNQTNSALPPSRRSSRTSVGTTSIQNPTFRRDVHMEASSNFLVNPLFNGSYRPVIDTAGSLGEWPPTSLRRKTESDAISPTRHGHDLRQSSLNCNERRPDQTYFDLIPHEFRSSPPPLDHDLSEIESNDHPPSTPVNVSRRSTRVSISIEPKVSSVEVNFCVPPDTGLQPVICPSGNRIVFLSKKIAFIHSLQERAQASAEESIVKIEGNWRRASLAGQFVALLGENNQVVGLCRLDAEGPTTIDLEGIPSNLARLSTLIVSSQGDLVLRVDNNLHVRRSRNGAWVVKRTSHEDGNLGKEKLRAICFGPSGEYLFGWSCGFKTNVYHWYIWRVDDTTETPIYQGYDTPSRFFDNVEPLMIPSFTDPVILTYDHHHHKASLMRQGHIRSKHIDHVTTGVMSPNADVVFLLRQCTPKLKQDFYVIDMMEFQEEKDGSYSFGKCQQIWDSKKSRLKVVKSSKRPKPTMVVTQGDSVSSFVILVAQADGYVEKIQVHG